MVPADAAAWTVLPWNSPAGQPHLPGTLTGPAGSSLLDLAHCGSLFLHWLTGCYTGAAPYAPWGCSSTDSHRLLHQGRSLCALGPGCSSHKEAATPGPLLMRPGAWIFLQLSFQDWKLKIENRNKIHRL